MKKTIAIIVAAVFIIAAGLGAYALLRKLEVKPTGKNYSDEEKIFINIIDVDNSGKSPRLTVRWHNDSDTKVTYSPMYTIERLDGTEWVSAEREGENASYPNEVYVIPAESMEIVEYSTAAFELERGETYRLRSWCNTSGGKTVRVWAEFTVE